MVCTYLNQQPTPLTLLQGNDFFTMFVVYTPCNKDIDLPARRTGRSIEVVFVGHTIGHLLRVYIMPTIFASVPTRQCNAKAQTSLRLRSVADEQAG